MLIFTNRVLQQGADESVFTRSFEPGAQRLALATVQAAAAGGAAAWQVSQQDNDVDDGDSMRALLPLFQGPRPVLVYLHGNNNTPADCFERCARLESLYQFEVIGFSWASEGYLSDGSELPGLVAGADGGEMGIAKVTAANRSDSAIQRKIRRYHQAKINAQDSVDSLARFFRMLGTARLFANTQPFSLAAHSLGAHFLQNALEIPGASESLGTAHNVALLAACTRASGHREWVSKLRPKGQVFVACNRNDSVLLGAYIADGGQLKLGATPGNELLQSTNLRYVDFTNGPVGLGGHGYFVQKNMPKQFAKLFRRIFGSVRDFELNQDPREIYKPFGCDADNLTCSMGPPTKTEFDAG